MSFDYEGNPKKLDEFYAFLQGLKTSDEKGKAIPLLQKMQELFGYIPEDLVVESSVVLGISTAEIYGVASFYSQFSLKPKGRYIVNICLGTACYVKGAAAVLAELEEILGIKAGDTTEDGLYSIDTTRCVGACGLAPVMEINGKIYGKMTPEKVSVVIAALGEVEEIE